MQEKPKNKLRPKTKKIYKQIPLKDSVEMEDIINEINKSFPINFKSYNFINELHKNYPIIPKDQVALIAKTMFEIIRESIINGYSISAKNLFNEFHLIISNNKKFDFLKISNRTLPKIRKREVDEQQ